MSHRVAALSASCRALLCALLSGLAACAPKLPPPVDLTSEDWGAYQAQPPNGPPQRLVFAFGSAGDAPLDAATQALARRGALVARVDVNRFSAGLAGKTDACLYLSGMVEWHTNYLGRRFGLTRLDPPLLIGSQRGAGVVYALLAQAAELAFSGGVTDPPDATLGIPLHRPLCNLDATPDSTGHLALPAVPLGAPWWVSRADRASPLLAAAAARSGAYPLQALPTRSLAQAAIRAFDATAAARRVRAGSVADLPLVELPAQPPSDTLAIIYSGDGGWRDLDRTLGAVLNARGIPVVGVDVLRYFWHTRSPADTAADLARLIDHYRGAWGSRRVLLIGYSFGADILPFAYNRLPPAQQAQVTALALLAPERGADFEVSIAGWLGNHTTKEQPTGPELQRIPPAKVLCIYGADEADDSLCTAPESDGIMRLKRPGGHHFDEHYELIADAITAHFKATGGQR
jgi:type IV secretory pathway VirJ component